MLGPAARGPRVGLTSVPFPCCSPSGIPFPLLCTTIYSSTLTTDIPSPRAGSGRERQTKALELSSGQGLCAVRSAAGSAEGPHRRPQGHSGLDLPHTGGCAEYWRVCGSPRPPPLDACHTPLTPSSDNPKCLQTWPNIPWGQNQPCLRTMALSCKVCPSGCGGRVDIPTTWPGQQGS